MQESWKPIPRYENIYEVSSHGNVRGVDRTVFHTDGRTRKLKGRVLKPRENLSGYYQVNLCKEGKCKQHSVHRLVAISFARNPLNLKEVNHIDGDSKNNHMDNLEWCTRADNMKHAKKLNLIDYQNLNSKISDDLAEKIRETYSNTDLTQKEIGEKFGLDQSQVSRIVNNKRWKNNNLKEEK